MSKKKKTSARRKKSVRTKPMHGEGVLLDDLATAPVHYAEHMIGPDAGPMGWEDEPDWVEDSLSRMPTPMLEDTAYYAQLRFLVRGHEDVMPWEWEEQVLGKRLRAHHQFRGTCVSQGFAKGVQLTAMADMLFGDEGEEWVARVHPGSIYGASRVEIGGGRIRGDGSLGAWAARAVTKMGVLYRIKYGRWDLTDDRDELHSVEWGKPGRGVPDELEPAMREHPISDTSMVTSGEQYKTVAYEKKVVPVCSNVGYTTVRDKYGLCYPSGTWNHCMLLAGILLIKHPQHPSGLEAVPQYQSWGQNNPSGNDTVTLQTGQEIKLPPGVFLVPIDAADRQLRQRDSFALAGNKGWTARDQINRAEKAKAVVSG